MVVNIGIEVVTGMAGALVTCGGGSWGERTLRHSLREHQCRCLANRVGVLLGIDSGILNWYRHGHSVSWVYHLLLKHNQTTQGLDTYPTHIWSLKENQRYSTWSLLNQTSWLWKTREDYGDARRWTTWYRLYVFRCEHVQTHGRRQMNWQGRWTSPILKAICQVNIISHH